MRASLLVLAGLTCLSLACSPKNPPTQAPSQPAPSSGTAQKAVIELEKGGKIELELYPQLAPATVANFAKLAGQGFYKGLSFHRVEPGFVVQGGDPNGNGTGGPGWTIPGEFTREKKHIKGTLAMARTNDPNSAGSQFYICLGPAPFLDGNYAIFGQVIAGMELVEGIKQGDRMKSVNVLP